MRNCLMIMIGCLVLAVSGPAMAAGSVDNGIYALLLKRHVSHGRVNYDGFKKDEALLDAYLDILSKIHPRSLAKNDQFAFYINAYNAFTIKLVLTRYPGINSIKEIGGFFSGPWKKKFIPLNGGTVSLDHIEHDILRPIFKDPRIHFAINCASKGCPPLLNTPYEGETLDRQLDEQAKSFINNKRFNFYNDGVLFVSKIFNWFEDDFNGNPLGFIRQYANGELSSGIASRKGEIQIKYLEYDWSLNR